MPNLDPLNPEKFVPLRHPASGPVEHVFKRFDDPDFIMLYLGAKKDFEVSWATNANAMQSVDLISEFAEENGLETGTIVLKHAFRRPNTIIGGANHLEGSAEDVLNEVQDSGDRAVGYTLHSKQLGLAFRQVWPRTYHDIKTNEFVLTISRKNSMARFILGRTISLTAMEGLKQSTEVTLNELAEFVPILRA